jgi:hypothetical protein
MIQKTFFLTKLLIYLIVKSPKDIPYYFQWVHSLNKKLSIKEYDKPWFTFKAIKWLNNYLKPDMIVFEYGSGASTLYLLNKVKKIISIEHDANWYNTLTTIIKEMKTSNLDYILIEPEILSLNTIDVDSPDAYRSGSRGYDKLDFSKYVKLIDNYPNETFDLIIIDGRSRASCIKHSINKIKKTGVILLDNSDRGRYQKAISIYLNDFKSKHFYGIGPYSTGRWQTSIYFK